MRLARLGTTTLEIGSGFSIMAASSRLSPFNSVKSRYVDGSGVDFDISAETNTSVQDIYNSNHTELFGEAHGWAASGSVKLSLQAASKFSASTFAFSIRVSKIWGRYKLLDNTLSGKAQKLAGRPSDFFSAYGTHFVESDERHGGVTVTILTSSLSQLEVNELKGELEASVGFGSIAARFDRVSNHLQRVGASRLEVKMAAYGVPGISDFIDGLGESSKIVEALKKLDDPGAEATARSTAYFLVPTSSLIAAETIDYDIGQAVRALR